MGDLKERRIIPEQRECSKILEDMGTWKGMWVVMVLVETVQGAEGESSSKLRDLV